MGTDTTTAIITFINDISPLLAIKIRFAANETFSTTAFIINVFMRYNVKKHIEPTIAEIPFLIIGFCMLRLFLTVPHINAIKNFNTNVIGADAINIGSSKSNKNEPIPAANPPYILPNNSPDTIQAIFPKCIIVLPLGRGITIFINVDNNTMDAIRLVNIIF